MPERLGQTILIWININDPVKGAPQLLARNDDYIRYLPPVGEGFTAARLRNKARRFFELESLGRYINTSILVKRRKHADTQMICELSHADLRWEMDSEEAILERMTSDMYIIFDTDVTRPSWETLDSVSYARKWGNNPHAFVIQELRNNDAAIRYAPSEETRSLMMIWLIGLVVGLDFPIRVTQRDDSRSSFNSRFVESFIIIPDNNSTFWAREDSLHTSCSPFQINPPFYFHGRPRNVQCIFFFDATTRITFNTLKIEDSLVVAVIQPPLQRLYARPGDTFSLGQFESFDFTEYRRRQFEFDTRILTRAIIAHVFLANAPFLQEFLNNS